jgi:hypothetical protein
MKVALLLNRVVLVFNKLLQIQKNCVKQTNALHFEAAGFSCFRKKKLFGSNVFDPQAKF